MNSMLCERIEWLMKENDQLATRIQELEESTVRDKFALDLQKEITITQSKRIERANETMMKMVRDSYNLSLYRRLAVLFTGTVRSSQIKPKENSLKH